jgi:type IV fimbrial biogenesis protein FimT
MKQMTIARRDKHAGFTLTELLLTVSLIGLLLTLAVPSFSNLILTQNVRAGASDLQTSFIFARSEAIKRAAPVSVVPTGGNWKNGWSVQLADGTVLRKEAPLNAQLAPMSGSTISYQSDGHIPPPVLTAIKVYVTGNPSVAARCLALDLSGRPSLLVSGDGNGNNGCS